MPASREFIRLVARLQTATVAGFALFLLGLVVFAICVRFFVLRRPAGVERLRLLGLASAWGLCLFAAEAVFLGWYLVPNVVVALEYLKMPVPVSVSRLALLGASVYLPTFYAAVPFVLVTGAAALLFTAYTCRTAGQVRGAAIGLSVLFGISLSVLAWAFWVLLRLVLGLAAMA